MTRRRYPKGTPRGGQFAPDPASLADSASKSAATAAAIAREAHSDTLNRSGYDDRTPSEEVKGGPRIEITPAESQHLREELDRYLQERYSRSGQPSEQQRARARKHIEKLRQEIARRDAS